MSEPVFRHFCQSDEAEVRAFFDEMGAESASFFNVGHGNERRVMGFFENGKPDHRFYGLFEDGRMLALAFIWDLDRSVVWLGIAVRDGCQGRGLGGTLLDSVLADCRNCGYGGVLLRTRMDNISARRLYEKHGFVELGVHPSGEILYLRSFER